MGKYKTYEKYKPSGLEWLGDIPEHWSTIRIKFSTYVKGRIGWHGLKSDEFTDEGAYLVTGTDFENNQIDWSRCYHVSLERYAQDPYIQLQNGDLLITKDGTIGKTAIVSGLQGYATLNSGIFLTRPLRQDYLPEFLYWVLNSNCFYDYVNVSQTGTTINHLYQWTFENFAFQLPPISEQKQIARFLDLETTRIDTLITKKRQLIDLLQKKRDAIIHQAVTQGLNPDTSFRYGGIEWLDKIPTHWKSVRLKFIAESIQTGPFGSQLHFGDYTSGGIPVINPSHLYNGKIFADPDVAVDQKTWDRLLRHELLEGDIVFARRGELGRCGLVTSEEVGWLCGTGSMRVRLYKNWVLPAFIIQVLSINGAAEQLILESVGSTMDNLNTKVLGDLLLPLPPTNEQKNIISYLQERNEYFQILLEKTQASIDEMSKYRSSLITAAVTGKIDVREETN